LRIVFFGTPPFAARVLTFLAEHKVDIVAIVTRADKPRGRSLHVLPTPVKETAQKVLPHIPIHQPTKASTPEFAEILRSYKPDLFIVVAYGEILKQNILDIPSHLAINVHPSLLPKYRGAEPIRRCLMQGDKETGVTIMQMVLEMDAGDILEVVKTPLPLEMNFGELDLKLSELSGPLLLKVIQQIEHKTLKKIPQDHAQATFALKMTPVDEQINWDRSALEIHNQIRAFSPIPGVWTWVEIGGEKKRLKIKKSLAVEAQTGSNQWIVPCGKGFLSILEVQLEGKKNLSSTDFLRGLQAPIRFLNS
jgi:methionyl-tRNA formyltransferase